MHILYINQHFSTPKGAAGIRSYEMARRLIHHGHSVTMVCGSYGLGQTGLSAPFVNGRRRGVVDGIDVIEFDLAYSNRDGFLKRSLTFAKFAWGSIGVALRERYDMGFATTTPLTAGIPVLLARWLRRKPYVFEVRDLWPELPKAMGVIRNPLVLGALSLLEWLSYRNAVRCIALAPGIAAGIAHRGVPADRIVTIPNGCDIGLLRGSDTPWRPDGVSDNDLLAVFSGTHGQANGLDAALDAAAVLQARGRDDIKILLIGDGKLKPALQQRAAELGLNNLLFHPPVDKARLAGLLAGADIGLQLLANVPAFYYGTSPNKFFDYIAAGLPVLNNYPGWLAEMIMQTDCGYTVPPHDADVFADALIDAAEYRDRLRQKGRNAASLAESRFNRADLSDQWVAAVTTAPR